MIGRAILLFGRWGWLYLLLTGATLAPLYWVRIEIDPPWILGGIESVLLLILVQMAIVVVPMAIVPYFVMRHLSVAPRNPYGWSTQVGISLPVVALLSGVSFFPSVAVAIVVALLTGPAGAVLALVGALVFWLHKFGHHLINVQARVIQQSGLSGVARPYASQRTFAWMSRVVSVVCLGGYLVVPHLILESQVARDIVHQHGWWPVVAVEAVLVTLWSVVTTVAWHETYGPVDTLARRELIETFA